MVNEGPRSTPAVLRVRGLSKRFARGPLWQKRASFVAVNEVELESGSGETLALVGS